nr:adenylate/guanylate cyclase domain-containing protein [Leptospira fainei]
MDPAIETTITQIRPYIPSAIYKRLAEENESKFYRSQIVDGAILFFDVVNFTPTTVSLAAKGTRGIDILQSTLSEYYTKVIEHIHSWGGVVYQFAGDSLLVSFEASESEPKGNSALRAASCSLDLFPILSSFKDIELLGDRYSLQARIGLGYGGIREIILGESSRFFRAVLSGHPVQEAVDAEKIASGGEVIISKSLFDQLPTRSIAFEEISSDFYKLINLNIEVKRPFGASFPELIHSNPERLLKRSKRFIVPELLTSVTNIHRDFSGDYREITAVFLHVEPHLRREEDRNNLNKFVIYVQSLASSFNGTFLMIDLSDKGAMFVIVFGAPQALENKEALAQRFALRVLDKSSEFVAGKDLQIGIATGMAYTGDLGAPFRKDFTAIGELMNIAARLATIPDEKGILIDANTKAKSGRNFQVESADEMELKGIKGSVRIFRLLEESKNIPGLLVQYRDPIIGRTEELNTLHRFLEKGMQSEGQVCRVVAEAGLGKSRLTNTFIDQAYERNVEILLGYCYPYEKFTPFYPWKELLGLFFGIFEDDSPQGRLSKIESSLKTLPTIDPSWAKPLLSLLGTPIEEDPLTKGLSQKQKNERVFEIITELLSVRSSQKPLLLVFEDVHWADELSLRLLEKISSRILDMKALLILVSRPEGQFGESKFDSNENSIILREFTIEEAKEFLLRKFHLESGGFIDKILVQSNGNPFFLESIVHNLIEEGALINSENGNLYPVKSDAEINIPNSLNDVLLARVDRLDEQEKIVLKTASVAGRLIHFDTLSHLLPQEIRKELSGILQALETLDLTPLEAPDPLTYIFKHIVIRDIVYNTLLHSTRESLHRKIASFIEDKASDNLSEQADILSFHYKNSGDTKKAFEFSLMAAGKARENYANQDAIYHYKEALEILGKSGNKSKEAYSIKEALANVYRQAGEYVEAEILFKECLNRKISKTERIRLLTGLGQIYQEQDNSGPALRSLEKALALTGLTPPKRRLGTIFKIIVQIPLLLRFSLFGPALSSAKKQKLLSLRSAILVALSKIYLWQDTKKFGWAVFSNFNATQRYETFSQRALAEAAMGQVLSGLNLFSPARKFLDKSLTLAETIEDPYARAVTRLLFGAFYMMQNKPREGLPYLHEGIGIYRQVGEKWELLSALSIGGFMHYFLSDFKTSRTFFDDIGTVAEELGARLQAKWTRIWSPYFSYLLGELSADELEAKLLAEANRAAHEKDLMNELSTLNKLLKLSVMEGWPEKAAEWSNRSYRGFLECDVKMPQLQIGNVYNAEAALFVLKSGFRTDKAKFEKIIETGIHRGLALGKALPYLHGPALALHASYLNFKGKQSEARQTFEIAEMFLSKQPNRWEHANCMLEAGMNLNDSQRIETAKNLFIELGAAADLRRLKRIRL